MLSTTEWTVIASRPANKPEVRWQWVDGYEPGATRRAAEAHLAGLRRQPGAADALPALGIVAAVLGVIKTMGSIDQPPAILGAMVGSALVGTFLGVLLSYGIVGPLSARLKAVIDEDSEIYLVVRRVIIATLKGQPQPLVIEAARTAISPTHQPSFSEIFDGMRTAK